MQRPDAGLGTEHVCHGVVVRLDVLATEPLRRDLRQAFLEVAGRQERGRVDREEARPAEVRNCRGEKRGDGLPERDQVDAGTGDGLQLLKRPLTVTHVLGVPDFWYGEQGARRFRVDP